MTLRQALAVSGFAAARYGGTFAIAAFRRFGGPPPWFGDLALNGVPGAVGGVPTGMLLCRVARPRLPRW